MVGHEIPGQRARRQLPCLMRCVLTAPLKSLQWGRARGYLSGMRRWLLIAALTGCGGDDEVDPSTRCSELGQSVCQTNANCAVETGYIAEADRSTYVSNCVSGFRQALDCSRITKVTGNPDVCESEFASTPCAQFDSVTGLPLPASCRGVFE